LIKQKQPTLKKKNVFLFVIFLIFSIFVSAQDTTRKDITIQATHITLIKDRNVLPKNGHYEITFSKYPRLVYFKDIDENSIMRIKLGELLRKTHMEVADENGKSVDATALTFDAEANGKFSILFTTVFLDSDKSVYAIGITLSNFTISVRFQDGDSQIKPTN
jgi:hypothetical protein